MSIPVWAILNLGLAVTAGFCLNKGRRFAGYSWLENTICFILAVFILEGPLRHLFPFVEPGEPIVVAMLLYSGMLIEEVWRDMRSHKSSPQSIRG